MSPSERRSDLRAQAIAYARRGWPVFPLVPGNKTPLTHNGFKDAVPNETVTGHQALDQISAWWSAFPDANIGLATGHAFDVLDIDGKDGLDGLQKFLLAQGAENWKHEGPVGITGKGWHYLFLPTGSGNRAKLTDHPIDFRGAGGYIVAPPSLHPLGHHYRWDEANHRTETTPLPEAPAWLTTLLGERRAGAKPAPVTHIVPDRAPPGLGSTVKTKTGELRDSRPNILDAVRQMHGDIFPKGRYYVTNCFFHYDPGPSMVLYVDDNTFHCYGCDSLGDSLNLLAGKDMNGKPVTPR